MTLTEKQYEYAIKVINKVLEPKIRELIATTNKQLEKSGIVLGADIQWITDGVEESTE